MAEPEFTAEELATEEWQDILEYEGRYAVSSLGRVLSITFSKSGQRKAIILFGGSNGRYPVVLLHKIGRKPRLRRIHLLVARAFHGECPDGHEVNHIDTNKSNNRAGNLEYLTHKENMAHAQRHGLMRGSSAPRPKGEDSTNPKLTDADVIRIRQRLLDGHRPAAIALDSNITRAAISSIKLGKTWKHLEPLREEVNAKIGKPWVRVNRRNVGYPTGVKRPKRHSQSLSAYHDTQTIDCALSCMLPMLRE